MTAVLGVDERALRAEVARQPEIDAASAATARQALDLHLRAPSESARHGLGPGVELMVDHTARWRLPPRSSSPGNWNPTISPGSRNRSPGRSRRSGGGAPMDDNPHCVGRARIHAVRLPGSAGAPSSRYRAADIRSDGMVHAPDRPGPRFTLRADALERFLYVDGPEFEF